MKPYNPRTGSGDTVPLSDSPSKSEVKNTSESQQGRNSKNPPSLIRPPSRSSDQHVAMWMTYDILRIFPENQRACRAVHELLAAKSSETLDAHHRPYLTCTGQGPASRERAPITKEEGETDDEEAPPETAETFYQGYFRIGFDCPTINLGLKWMLGRGTNKFKAANRNVDILLAPIGSDLAKASELGSRHLMIDVKSASGVWRLVATDELAFDGEILEPGQSHALHKPVTSLEVNGMRFCIRFAIRNAEEEYQYRTCRDLRLKHLKGRVPASLISGIPFDNDLYYPEIVFRHGLGAGSYAACYEGFHPVTGNLRVAKQLVMKNEHDRRKALAEYQALKNFQNPGIGIVKLYASYTSTMQDPETGKLPLILWLVMEKGIDFQRVPWSDVELSKIDYRIRLAKDLLEGLRVIHDRGCMHRDITPGNVLLHVRPLSASFCDFGMVCSERTSNHSVLCHQSLLPPEVEYQGNKPYDQSVDIFLLGQVFAMRWFPEAYKGMDLRLNHKGHHEIIVSYLLRVKNEGQGNPLAGLVAHMVAWKPTDRPSTNRALTHKCFNLEDQAAEESIGDKRRAPI